MAMDRGTAERQPGRASHGDQRRARASSPIEIVDHSYWPRALVLRIVIAFAYIALVAGGVLPMSAAWAIASGGGLLLYSVGLLAVYYLFGLVNLYRSYYPYADALVVTFAVVALARPDYPIWMGYFMVLQSLAVVRSTKYVAAFSGWCMANFWGGMAILAATDRAEIDWTWGVIVSIMALFTAANTDIISASTRKLHALVYRASLTDPLTDLANRRRFQQVLDDHGSPDCGAVAVFMYDIDNFKQMNETRGHTFADGVLVRVARELEACFREADVIARYGGDEIIILAHMSSLDEALAAAERSVTHVTDTVGVTVSVGVSAYPSPALTIDAAVQQADSALGRAKRAGKARAMIAEAAA